MKVSLSGNSWDSVWDGSSNVKVLTWEVYNGKSTQIYDYFRKYPCIEDSIKDHAAYLLGAMNGNKKRYEGLLDAKDYKKAITIIKNGGYATDPDYISKICAIIQRFGLDKYDASGSQSEKSDTQASKTTYRVQVGAYKVKKNAEKKRDSVKKASGYSCVVTSSGGLYLVICGSFKIKTNAESRIAALKKLKIEAFINEI
jgi:flagellum-specific peptidoglycan hydrolase FlgJ